MLKKSQLDAYKLQMIPNILNWNRITKVTIFGGSQGEGQVVVPTSGWVHRVNKLNKTKLFATLFLSCDVDGGDKLTEQINWMLDPSSEVAQNLVDLARLYGFDGYFINGESSAIQSQKKAVGAFVQKIKLLAAQAKYPLDVEWYVVGSVDVNDTVVDEKNRKKTDSVFIDHYAWSSFSDNWNALSPEARENYNPWDVEYGAYNLSELDTILHNYGAGASVSYFTFSGYATPNKELLNDEAQEDKNLRAFWAKYASAFPDHELNYELPFYTSFNTGRGKDFYITGQSVNYDRWNSIALQTALPQLDMLPENMSFDYENVFAGGSSLSVNLQRQFKNSLDKIFCTCFNSFRKKTTLPFFRNINIAVKGVPVEAGITFAYQGNNKLIKDNKSPQLCLNGDENCCFNLAPKLRGEGQWESQTIAINRAGGQCQLSSVKSMSLNYNEVIGPVSLNLGEIYLTKEEGVSYRKNMPFTLTKKDRGWIVSWELDPHALFYDIYKAKDFLAETVHDSYWVDGDDLQKSDLQIVPVYANLHSKPF